MLKMDSSKILSSPTDVGATRPSSSPSPISLSSGEKSILSVLGGQAFLKLNKELREKMMEQVEMRRMIYELALQRGYTNEIVAVILGDKPGPGRPTESGYHHTPFFSTKNSSLWLNKQLIDSGVDERNLLWFNVEHADGQPLDPIHLVDVAHLRPTIICLGGNAERWVRKHFPDQEFVKLYHPQFAKRFRSHEPYGLVDEIKKALKKSDIR